MKKDYLTTPKGTRDILMEEWESQNWVEEKLQNCFRSYGYCPVSTPGVEYLDVFAEGAGNSGSEHMLKLIDNEGKILVLRPDSTAPIARVVASRLKMSTKPLRLYYNQRVYQQKGLYSGHRTETSQMGAELIGANSMRADLEMLQLAVELLERCGMEDYRIELGHGGLCELLISRLETDAGGKEQLRELIRAKNYPALNDFLDSLDRTEGVAAVRALPGLFGGREVLEQAEGICGDGETREIIGYMRGLFAILRELGLKDRLMLDLGFVNDKDYYTGIIFQAYLPGFGEAVLLGGRYDRLLERFGEKLPAVGFGVNVDLLSKYQMREGSRIPAAESPVLVWGGEGFAAASLRYAGLLRETEGCTVENALFDSLAQCKVYAAAKGIKQLHVVGESVEVFGEESFRDKESFRPPGDGDAATEKESAAEKTSAAGEKAAAKKGGGGADR